MHALNGIMERVPLMVKYHCFIGTLDAKGS